MVPDQSRTGAPTTARPPSISIVIPVFNGARFLDETLAAVQAQTVTDWECVVVDDGSTDDSFAIAARFAADDSRFRVVRTRNGGASAARNCGYVQTDPRSEFVTFMDADDSWLPHALEVLRGRLLTDTAATGAHGIAEAVDAAGNLFEGWSHSGHGRSRLGREGNRLVPWPLDRPTTFDVLINGNVLFPPGLLLGRREAYEKAGRFDERITGGEDWDMLIRLSRFGYLSFVDEVILQYRRHDANMGAAEGIEGQAWLVRCKGFHSPDNDPEQRVRAARGWKAYQRYMIAERLRSARKSVREGNAVAVLDSLARVPVHAFRFLRGYPTPRVVRASEPWAREADPPSASGAEPKPL